MDAERYKRTAKRLSVVFLVVFLIISIGGNIYVVYERAVIGYNPITMFSGYYLFSMTVLIAVYLPMLFIIQHYAKLAAMKKLLLTTRILVGYFSLATLFLIFITFSELLNPGMFT